MFDDRNRHKGDAVVILAFQEARGDWAIVIRRGFRRNGINVFAGPESVLKLTLRVLRVSGRNRNIRAKKSHTKFILQMMS